MFCRVCKADLNRLSYAHAAKRAYCDQCGEQAILEKLAFKEATKHLAKKKRTPFPDRLRSAAAAFVKIAVQCGYLPKYQTLNCVVCGKPAQCYDHRDYSRPMEVRAVCLGCNVRSSVADQGELYQFADALVQRNIDNAKPLILRIIKIAGAGRFLDELYARPSDVARMIVRGTIAYQYERIAELSEGQVTPRMLRPDLFHEETVRKAA